jgi:DHA2 family multidrug resistance protein
MRRVGGNPGAAVAAAPDHHPIGAGYSLTDPAGIAALNHELTRQATMVAYIDDFKLLMLISIASIPLVLLLRRPMPRAPRPAAAD